MIIKSIVSGFVVKLVTGFDDTLTRVPILSSLTRTRRGKLAFLVGVFFAVSLAILLSFLFAAILRNFVYYHIISAVLIFFLAFAIYFDILLPKSKKKIETKLKRTKKPVPLKKLAKLMGIGFLTAFVTVIDDSIAYSSVFLALNLSLFVILGIYIALILQLYVTLVFSTQLSKIKYKKEISVFGLLIIGFLILFKVI